MALTEARRGFDEQSARLTKLRANVGGLLGYGGVAFSVLFVAPGATVTGSNSGPLLWTALAAFCGLALTAVYVMWPVKVIPGAQASELVRWADDGDADSSMTRNLALHFENAYQQNRKSVDRRTWASMASLVLFSAAIVLLMTRLTGV